MWFKIKVSYDNEVNGKQKHVIDTYLTEATNFADAGYKAIQVVGTDVEVEDVCMMKNFKPSANEYFEESKIFIVKVSEEMLIEDNIKTVKYSLPVFARDNEELQKIMKEYIRQGLEDMRLTTISETKWIYIA